MGTAYFCFMELYMAFWNFHIFTISLVYDKMSVSEYIKTEREEK